MLVPYPSRKWGWRFHEVNIPWGLTLEHANERTLHLDCINWEGASVHHISDNSFIIYGSPCIDGTSDQAKAIILYDGLSFQPLIAQYDLLDLEEASGLTEVESLLAPELADSTLYVSIKVNSVFPRIDEVVSIDLCSGEIQSVDADFPLEFSTASYVEDTGSNMVLKTFNEAKGCLTRDFLFGDSYVPRS